MDKKAAIQRKIDQALESVNDIVQATPSSFFYTRLMARIENKEKNLWERLSGVITRPSIAIVTVLLVLALNAIVVLKGFYATENTSEYFELAVADEYNNVTAFYDIDNIQP